jgi:biotin carboxyl carrier protein
VAQKDLAHQAALFTEGRIRQLEARIAEIQTSIEAAAARREEATAAVERASSLIKSGSVSTVELGRLTRDQTITLQTEMGTRRRLDATQVELTAVREGTFLGDSYNDRPSSVQREEEMRQRAEGLTADIAQADAEIAWLAGEIASEQFQYISRSEAEIKVPVAGRIWEVMTAPGEDVRAGQPLIRLLDCTGAVVTANVTESVYNRLQLGSVAHFRPSDGGPELDGTVVNLTGSAGAAANLAINPDALSKDASSSRQTVRESYDPRAGTRPYCARILRCHPSLAKARVRRGAIVDGCNRIAADGPLFWMAHHVHDPARRLDRRFHRGMSVRHRRGCIACGGCAVAGVSQPHDRSNAGSRSQQAVACRTARAADRRVHLHL